MTPTAAETAAPPVTLVVADPELAAQLERYRLGPVLRVNNYLSALGELSRRPVRAVIGRASPLAVSVEATARALRQLAPECRLILCVDGDEEPLAMRAVRLGFDDYLVRPVRADELRQALSGLVAPSVAATSRPPVQPEAPPSRRVSDAPRIQTPPEPVDPVRSAPPRDDPAPDRGGSQEPRSFVFQPRSATPQRSEAPDGIPLAPADSPVAWRADEDYSATRLGDIELVEQLLRDRRGTLDLALRAIRQRLPGHDVNWSQDAVASARACLPIEYGTHNLGYLVSDTASRQWLSGYAAWLGRWMMLARHIDHLNELALRDELTGVWNRRYFIRFLNVILKRARRDRFRVTLMVYDIDDFKTYNDRYGHEAGDAILSETARLMESVVRKQDVVARIGGDEFAVVFWDAEAPRGKGDHPSTVRAAAQRFQRAVCEHRFPRLIEDVPATLTISGGLAGYPWDGQTPEQLLRAADRMLLESKRQGKNAITFGPGAIKTCELEEYRRALDSSADPDG